MADQQRALKNLRVGAASSEWTVAFAGEGNKSVTARPVQGQPNNWKHLKQELQKYVSRAQNREAPQRFPIPSKGFIHLDRSGDPNGPTADIGTYLPPGCVTVSMHGERPFNLDTGEAYPGRNARPFFDGVEASMWNPRSGPQTTDYVVGLIKPQLDPLEDAPIFLNSCNAGTASDGYIPARDVAEQTGRFVIAPTNSRILATARGPQLSDKGGEWRVFRPDGTSELLYKPTQYSQATPVGH